MHEANSLEKNNQIDNYMKLSQINDQLAMLNAKKQSRMNYINIKSKAKCLFRIPTQKYLTEFVKCDFDFYPKILKELASTPQILMTDENKNIELQEKAFEHYYACGQFNEDDILHGYGFVIHK